MIIGRRCVYCLFPVNPVGDGLMLLLLAWPKAKSYFLHKSQGVVAQLLCTSIEAPIAITRHSWYWFWFDRLLTYESEFLCFGRLMTTHSWI